LISPAGTRRVIIPHSSASIGKQFVDAGPTLGALTKTAFAAPAPVQGFRQAGQLLFRLIAFLAVGADLAHQALGEDADDGGGGQKRLDPHLHQAGQGAGGIVGVQGRKDHVTGQRRLHGDFGGFAVADLADHDDVRVLAQDRAQACGEGQLDLRVDLDLADAGELVFDGILDGDDVLLPVVEPGQGGVEGRGLARAGRTGNQEDADPCLRSRRRSTVRSPNWVGTTETRISTSCPPTSTFIRPSWGNRFSAIFSDWP
jgi:hypothetical protein